MRSSSAPPVLGAPVFPSSFHAFAVSRCGIVRAAFLASLSAMVKARAAATTETAASTRWAFWKAATGGWTSAPPPAAVREANTTVATAIHPLPSSLSFAQGAAVGVPCVTAWRALFQRARLQLGGTVFIHGASGGVGAARCSRTTAGSGSGGGVVGVQAAIRYPVPVVTHISKERGLHEGGADGAGRAVCRQAWLRLRAGLVVVGMLQGSA